LKTILQRRQNGTNHHYRELKILLKALRARTGVRKEDYFGEVGNDVLLETFPIWLVNMRDIYRVLPLDTELFDLAIIDEATQCDIASCLAIFQRARHVVITGDPKQLRHVSFLARSTQNNLITKHELNKQENFDFETFNYRSNSILDLVSDSLTNQEQVSFLNEHFRSTPAIIRFSNQHIYNNAIRVMTQKPDTPYNQGLTLTYCKGKREEDGINDEEVRLIVAKIKSLIEEESELTSNNCQSIGILSPFRSQVEYLRKAISVSIPIEFVRKHDILIGTAYEFQGEERDVMFLSFVVDNNSHSMAYRHLNKPDVFNVSITRARSIQNVFISFDEGQLNKDTLLYKFIREIKSDISHIEETSTHKDQFLDEVIAELQKLNIKTWPAYEIAGLKIDLIVSVKNENFGIDLIGYPGEFEDAFSMERYNILHRANLPIFPLSYAHWCYDKQFCMKEILKFIGQ
ncbi:MAG: DEAD/DEAH box helicase, partial [Bacteroidales bacterium]|nr:DEAD/DEAH box helicase [Bacteroidales bacterium]